MPYQFKREPLSEANTDKLVNACDDFKEKLAIWILLDSGMRVSELASLKKDQVRWQEDFIIVFGKGGPYGKKSKRRVIPMTPRVKRLLEIHFVTKNNIGLSPRTIQRIAKRVANRAGITQLVTPHILRHTFACNCVKRGVSTASLKKILGHDRLETTEIYLNIRPEDALKEFRDKVVG